MKSSAVHEFSVSTTARSDFIDITGTVLRVIRDSGVENGMAVVYVPHTTAGVTINENADPDVIHDIIAGLDRLVPWSSRDYRHTEGNSAAHIKSSIIGCSVTLIVKDGAPLLGTWQGVFFCEFDGPRNRKVIVRVSS